MIANMLAHPSCSVHAHAVRARCCEPVLSEADMAFAHEINTRNKHAKNSAVPSRTKGSGTATATTNVAGIDDVLAWVSAQEGASSGSDSGRFSDDDTG